MVDPVSSPSAGSVSRASLLPKAAALVALQGVFFLGYAVLELAHVSALRWFMGVSTALFFAGYGVALLLCARGLRSRQSWARGPVIMAQLIHLLVAWGFREGATWWVAVAGIGFAAAVMVLVLHPRSTRELA